MVSAKERAGERTDFAANWIGWMEARDNLVSMKMWDIHRQGSLSKFTSSGDLQGRQTDQVVMDVRKGAQKAVDFAPSLVGCGEARTK